jgi:hypothetical protein
MDRKEVFAPGTSLREKRIIQFGSIENYCKWCQLDSEYLRAKVKLLLFQQPIKDSFEVYKQEIGSFRKKF